MSLIDEATFVEIKAAQSDGLSSKEAAQEYDLSLGDTNAIYSARDWWQYSGQTKPTENSEPEAENTAVKSKGDTSPTQSEKILPAQSDYYKGLVAKKIEENSNLKEQRGWLLEQISYLKKVVGFLENRKRELEGGVLQMEKQLIGGVSAIEQLEETSNLTVLSERIKKRNE